MHVGGAESNPIKKRKEEKMKKTKKLISIVLALALVLSLAACGGATDTNTPEYVVKTFCEAIQSYDFEAAGNCMENGASDLEYVYDEEKLEEAFSSAAALEFFKDSAAKMTFEIGEADVEEENVLVKVPVTFTYVDATDLINEVLDEYLLQSLELAWDDVSDEEIEAALDEIFADKIESVKTGTAEVEFTFNCVMVEENWKIEFFSDEDEAIINDIITSNMESATEDYMAYDDDDYDYDDSWYEDETEISTWTDFPLGNGATLSNFNICFTACEETSELPVVYDEPEKAADGTKFVVFSVEVENTTKGELDFSNDYTLTDGFGREYSPYTSYNTLEYGEDFWYTTLSPNIPKTGVFIYNVPTDSYDYYVTIPDSETGTGYIFYAE